MQLTVPADIETLIKKRLSSGGYANAEDVLRRALEAQDAKESWSEEERRALSAHIEEGYLQAERGELIDGALTAWSGQFLTPVAAESPLRGHSRPDLTTRPVRFWTLTRYPNCAVEAS